MSRELKFRAFDTRDKRMITHEQDYIPLKICSLGVLRLDPTNENDLWEIINPSLFVLMQFTGLKDKKGTEIYEGDVVTYSGLTSNDCKIVRIVNYNNDFFRFQAGMYPLSDSEELIEVIGNIHQNPELIQRTDQPTE